MLRQASALGFLLLAACGRLSDAGAEQLVRDYNERVIEAYRTSDPQLAAALVGDGELKKLTGLIGVKRDADLVLDSALLALEVSRVERAGETVTVTTKERWHYRDRRIGTGEQVGDESTDDYEMRYVLVRARGRWVVDRIEWASPPKVGRAQGPLPGDAEHARLRPTSLPAVSTHETPSAEAAPTTAADGGPR